MKEQSVVDRKSARRINPQNTCEEINPVFNSMVIPSTQKKPLRKANRNYKDSVTTDLYHKRVKSDQIYSIKLLLKTEDKLKANKNKVKLINNNFSCPTSARIQSQPSRLKEKINHR